MYIDWKGPISVTGFGKIRYDSGYWHNGRSLKKNLLILVAEGGVNIRTAEKQLHLAAGDILFIPRGTSYTPLFSDGITYYFFHFNARYAEEGKNEFTAIGKNGLKSGCFAYSYIYDEETVFLSDNVTKLNPDKFEYVMSRLSVLDAGAGAWQKKMLEIIFREIIILTERKETASRSRSLDMMIRYIRENYNKNISLTCISQNFRLSKSYISRLFKKREHCTVSQFITRVRLCEACNLLCNSTLSVKEIAERCGYENQYYFSRVFRKHLNTTPTSFKEENKI